MPEQAFHLWFATRGFAPAEGTAAVAIRAGHLDPASPVVFGDGSLGAV